MTLDEVERKAKLLNDYYQARVKPPPSVLYIPPGARWRDFLDGYFAAFYDMPPAVAPVRDDA